MKKIELNKIVSYVEKRIKINEELKRWDIETPKSVDHDEILNELHQVKKFFEEKDSTYVSFNEVIKYIKNRIKQNEKIVNFFPVNSVSWFSQMWVVEELRIIEEALEKPEEIPDGE